MIGKGLFPVSPFPMPIPTPVQFSRGGTTVSKEMSEEQAAAWSHRTILAADSAQMSRDNSVHYADDARRAFQRRIDTVSNAEAMANQRLDTSRIALEALQQKSPYAMPPFVPGYFGGQGSPGSGQNAGTP